MQEAEDAVFRALSDATRRRLLDQLYEQNGQTLSELCRDSGMTRQSTTQHLDVLEAANLVSTVRRGREKLHYLNPVPIQNLQRRWIHKFEEPRLRALEALKQRLEEDPMTDKPSFVYVIYIESTPERVWQALTDAEASGLYWGHSNVSDWQVGSVWEHQRTDGSGIADVVGTVRESVPPVHLLTTWASPDDPTTQTRVAFDLEPYGNIVRLTVTHQDLADETEREQAAAGWAAVLSNLKSFVETGRALSEPPWEMPPTPARG